jgi:hypothetical protein
LVDDCSVDFQRLGFRGVSAVDDCVFQTAVRKESHRPLDSERDRVVSMEVDWISVEERLPSENDRYLTVSIDPWFGTTVVDTMRWSGVWMYDGRQTEAKVTHWMQLPEPPKEET